MINNITDFMSYNAGSAFTKMSTATSVDEYKEVLEHLDRAFANNENAPLAVNVIHEVYKVAANEPVSLKARALVNIASNDWRTAYICVKALLDEVEQENGEVSDEEAEHHGQAFASAEDNVEDAEVVE